MRAQPAREGQRDPGGVAVARRPRRPKSAEGRDYSKWLKRHQKVPRSALLGARTEACMSLATGTGPRAKREDDDDEDAAIRDRDRDGGPEPREARPRHPQRGRGHGRRRVPQLAHHRRARAPLAGGPGRLAQRRREQRRDRLAGPWLRRHRRAAERRPGGAHRGREGRPLDGHPHPHRRQPLRRQERHEPGEAGAQAGAAPRARARGQRDAPEPLLPPDRLGVPPAPRSAPPQDDAGGERRLVRVPKHQPAALRLRRATTGSTSTASSSAARSSCATSTGRCTRAR